MRLNYAGTIYRIGFKHGQETNAVPGHDSTVQDFTVAVIRKGERDTADENIVGVAKVRRFFKDPPSLEAARKAGLRKALKSMNASVEFRKAIWEAYHSRPGGLQFPATSANSAN